MSYYLAHAGAVAAFALHLAHLHPLGHAAFAFAHLAAFNALHVVPATLAFLQHVAPFLHPAAFAFAHLVALIFLGHAAFAFAHLAALIFLGHAALAFLHAESSALLHAFSSFIVLHPTNSPAARIVISTFFISSFLLLFVIIYRFEKHSQN